MEKTGNQQLILDLKQYKIGNECISFCQTYWISGTEKLIHDKIVNMAGLPCKMMTVVDHG